MPQRLSSFLIEGFFWVLWLGVVASLASCGLWFVYQGYLAITGAYPGSLVKQAAIVLLALWAVVVLWLAEAVASALIDFR